MKFYKNIRHKLGAALMQERCARRQTLKSVANACNITPDMLEMIELGNGRISLKYYERLLNLYKKSVVVSLKQPK